MMLQISSVLNGEQLRECQRALANVDWQDGRATAGHVAMQVKDNQQLPLDSPVAESIGKLILQQLNHCHEFISAVLPLKVLPPRFNRYTGGGAYGNHIDNAILGIPNTGDRIRCDVSSTLFLSDPEEYDGGELVVEDSFGQQRVKLPAGHMVIYPGSSLHHVTPVTRGERLAAFFWTQSLVREDHKRTMLRDLDQGIQQVGQTATNDEAIARLTGVYHNLLRQWSDT